MDKTLEIVMVAVALVVAVVIVVGLLQGQADSFGNFASNQTGSSSCGIKQSQLETAADCSTSPSSYEGNAETIYDNHNSQCGLPTKSTLCS
ncbi:hypothetical protein GLT81_00160 [Nanohaloarchaea archaeon]|jgi:hypothetical protein|nr:hypothetical protein [Candidatus Nanohaloarchaea archaeon]